MSTVTYLACDHCSIEDTNSGVGRGNISSISIDVELPLANKSKQFLTGHLCINCQQEILTFLKGFGL